MSSATTLASAQHRAARYSASPCRLKRKKEMTIIPLWAKALILAAIVAASVFAIHRLDVSRQKIGYDKAVAEYALKLQAAQDDAKAHEQAWQSQQLKQREKTNELLTARDTAYADLSRTTDRLRIAAANYGNGLSADTIAACRARAATLADVFGECAERLVEMGKASDGQFIDAVSCRGEWPK